MRRIRHCGLSIAVGILAARATWAQPAERDDPALEAVAIRVSGFPGCPSGEEFWRRLQYRASSIRPTRAGEPGRLFIVHFEEPEPGRTVGRLRILDLEGNALEREISGTTCGEVAEALTLVAAVATHGASPADPPLQADPPSDIPRQAEEAAAPSIDGNGTSQWSLLLRARTSIRTHIVPAALYGAGAGFELAHDGASTWQPAIGALVEATLSATTSTASVAANTEMGGQLAILHLYASPIRYRSGAIEVRPLASLDVGELSIEGRGRGLRREGQVRMFWMAAALSMQADVGLGRGWSLGGSLGMALHPFLYRLVYSDRDVHEVRDFGLIAGLSGAYRFE
jgi:hypothetical protein